MKKRQFFLSCLLAVVSFVLCENASDSVEETFEFINQAKEKLKLVNNAEIIVVVGNTGSGISTLVHYAAGDYSKLISIDPDEHSDYEIDDRLDPKFDSKSITGLTESRTFVPEMVIDEQNNVWYDCPGFANIHNETIEIASSFLIKSVIESASKVKIVLVVNYASVTKGYDRFDFDRLLTHASQLITNIERYKDSVSLVVTKVPSYLIKGAKTYGVLEESIIQSIVSFAKEHRFALLRHEKECNKKKIQIIDALITNRGGNETDYPKISIFWRPNDVGPFNEISKMKDGREQIRKSILEHTSYTAIQQNDFGFSLTHGARDKLSAMAHQIIERISVKLRQIYSHLVVGLRQNALLNDTIDIENDLEFYANGEKEFSQMKKSSLKDLIGVYATAVQWLKIPSMDTEFDRIVQQEQNLNILNSAAKTNISLSTHDWVAVSSEVTEFLRTEHNWYLLLVKIYEYLASYEVQRSVSIYNVANLADWKKWNRPQGLTIDASNFDQFLKLVSDSNAFTQTPQKLKELNEIINITLKASPQYECYEDTMTIKAFFFKSSDIQTSKCPSNLIAKINVFVVNTFFVDSDVNLNGYKELKIYADKWEIQRPVTFNLNGIDGKRKRGADHSVKAGEPGNAGSNAGNFFGLSNKIVNGELLTVNLNGGNGGVGQNGAGSLDEYPIYETKEGQSYRCLEKKCFSDWSKRQGFSGEFVSIEGSDKYPRLKFIVHAERCCGKTGLKGPGKSKMRFFCQFLQNLSKLF